MPDVYGTAQITGPKSALEDLHEAIILLDEHARVSGIKAPEDYIGHAFTSGDIPLGVYAISSTFEEPSRTRLEVSMKADYGDAAAKFLQGLASSFEFSIYWIHMVRGFDRQKIDFFAPEPESPYWRLRSERELDEHSKVRMGENGSSGKKALTHMNLSDPQSATSRGSWSEETVQCLKGVMRILKNKEQYARALQMPGNEETYRKLQKVINDIAIGGRDALDAHIADASRQVSSLGFMSL